MPQLQASDLLAGPEAKKIPQAAPYIALGIVHSPSRSRANVDSKGYDCNDYAFDAVQALQGEGQTPYYVAAQNEQGQDHLFAVYPTQDGVLYARDNRVAQDIPLRYLQQRGYKLLAASDASGQSWHALSDGN